MLDTSYNPQPFLEKRLPKIKIEGADGGGGYKPLGQKQFSLTREQIPKIFNPQQSFIPPPPFVQPVIQPTQIPSFNQAQNQPLFAPNNKVIVFRQRENDSESNNGDNESDNGSDSESGNNSDNESEAESEGLPLRMIRRLAEARKAEKKALKALKKKKSPLPQDTEPKNTNTKRKSPCKRKRKSPCKRKSPKKKSACKKKSQTKVKRCKTGYKKKNICVKKGYKTKKNKKVVSKSRKKRCSTKKN